MNFLKNKRTVKVLALLLIITTLLGLVSVASYADETDTKKETVETTVVDEIDTEKYDFTVDGITYIKTGKEGENTVALVNVDIEKVVDGKTEEKVGEETKVSYRFNINTVKEGDITYKVTAIYSMTDIGMEKAVITIGENVEYIADQAFKNLENVELKFDKAENIKTIGAQALMGIGKLSTSLNNFTGLTMVGKEAFDNISEDLLKANKAGFILLANGKVLYKYTGEATEVTLPEEVTVVAGGAFAGNEKITKVDLNNKVTTIGNEAFYGCKLLKDVLGADYVTYAGKDAFYSTEFIKNLKADSENEGFCRMTTDTTKPGYGVAIAYKGNEKKNVKVPATVTFLSNAFDKIHSEDTGLKESLESVIIPVNAQGICDGCFDGFSKLKKITINNSSDKSHGLVIGSRAFAGTAVSEFTVPAQILSIAPDALDNCANLKTILVRYKKGWQAAGGGFFTYEANKEENKDLSVSFARYSPDQQDRSKVNDTGIMYYINMIFGYILRFCSFISFGIYLIALFLFALVMKIILFPFGIKQQKGMIKQANFRPKEMAIMAKYRGRNDRATQQKMQQEIMEARQKENIGMMSGCMPMLLQLPILFILYNVIMNPLRYICGMTSGTISVLAERCKEIIPDFSMVRGDVELVRHLRDNWSEFEGLNGLDGFSKADLPDFSIGGLDLAEEPYIGMTLLILIPILTFAISYFSMKLTRKFSYQAPSPNGQDEAVSLKIMDFAMPALSTWIAFSVPAVIGCYWIFQNILSTVQQWVLSKLYPLPVFTEEDYKKAEKELMGKTPKVKPGSNYDPNRPKVRSLHHIDDDEDDLPPRKPDAVRDGEDDEEKGNGGNAAGGNSKIGKADLQ